MRGRTEFLLFAGKDLADHQYMLGSFADPKVSSGEGRLAQLELQTNSGDTL
jgi:hypothetical protein